MKIVFMGTPEFAVKSLERLYSDGHEISGVFTQEDKPRKRGMKVTFSPVKEIAVLKNTPVYQPSTLKDGKAAQIITALNCDLIVVVAYGKLLPIEILDIPPLGCINIHGSLLPKYRGASPIQYAILNGEKETGVTSQFISEKMDAGDIIFTEKTCIGDDETAGDLFLRLSDLGADLLSKTVTALSKGSVKRIKQNSDDVSYAPLLSKDMSPIDWSLTGHEIKCKVRGLNPWPIATMTLNNNVLKIYSVDISRNITSLSPGTVVSQGKTGLEIACADGTVMIKEIQPAGGKKMSAAEYLRGNPVN